ncbi:lipopolysaccharide heptosyltransferase II [Geobacter metallireducens RCH3]|uniref:lipopolysaccharide heptosyltransferase II n=1 Tax=Geobacter metallireducens (strain ATCC 53774 / DSM 7210 / GS-15) TaxID=269799 RepID=Q39T54_GEOMG|nr:lipopolysaccharide heptosyltransferase II [Geobacter metallireducens]ABB32570.1 ADP-heptose--lipopolysaccharide heptosyltransferase [Geobacter metallireducens GS-15]EHP86403.1 lipopolysaccharide heptosyltransferase II [Geobacter metallireducens RCH3]
MTDSISALDKSAIRTILVRAVNWLGDAVMTTPALRAIRESFPEARITVLANPLVAELFANHETVDAVHVYDRKGRHAGIRGRIRLARELRAERFDLAILLQNAIDAALIARLARIPRIMGYRTDGRGMLLTHGAPVTIEAKKLHHVDYYLAMLSRFGIETGAKHLSLTVTREEKEGTARLLAAAGIGANDFVIGINPGATYGSAKRWYPERFAAVADELSLRWGARVVVTGGPGEAAIAADIAAAMTVPALVMAGKTSVRELMALIKRCDFFITNDSGPMHIAAAFSVPLVAVFGPTDHTTTSPWSDRAAVVRRDTDCAPCLLRECPTDHRCMTAVTMTDVVEAAERLRTCVAALEHSA